MLACSVLRLAHKHDHSTIFWCAGNELCTGQGLMVGIEFRRARVALWGHGGSISPPNLHLPLTPPTPTKSKCKKKQKARVTRLPAPLELTYHVCPPPPKKSPLATSVQSIEPFPVRPSPVI